MNIFEKMNNNLARIIVFIVLIIGGYYVAHRVLNDYSKFLSFFVGYTALFYSIMKSLEREEEASKDKKRITKVKYVSSPKNYFGVKLNEQLEQLSEKNNKIIDVKIISVKESKSNINEAYIIYCKR